MIPKQTSGFCLGPNPRRFYFLGMTNTARHVVLLYSSHSGVVLPIRLSASNDSYQGCQKHIQKTSRISLVEAGIPSSLFPSSRTYCHRKSYRDRLMESASQCADTSLTFLFPSSKGLPPNLPLPPPPSRLQPPLGLLFFYQQSYFHTFGVSGP